MKASILSLCLVALISVVRSAQAAIIFDGTGNPGAVGYQFEGTGTATFNSNNGVPNSAPGFLHIQSSGNQYADYTLPAATLAAEISKTRGWAIDADLRVISSTALDVGMALNDGTDLFSVRFYPNEAIVEVPSGVAPVPISPGVFHSHRFLRGPSSPNVEYYLDGILVRTFIPSPRPLFELHWGDVNGFPGSSQAVWDRVAINSPPVPEPTSVFLAFSCGAIALAGRRLLR